MMQKEAVRQIVEEWMERTPFFLVDLKISPDNDIVIEFESEEEEVNIDDCVDLNKFIESKLDREIEDYSLEVGSAGLGQPFKVLKQYLIFIGEEVEVVAKDGKKFSGILLSADEQGFSIQVKRKVKPEGSKRFVTVDADETYAHQDVKSVCYHIRF